jgi:predicted nucleotidyltransferase component of viral defense system
MQEKFYTKKLYPLQDDVLKLIENESTGFYLGGGTALSRHYLDHRFSDDLDFFQNDSDDFKKDATKIINSLKSRYEENCNVTLLEEKFVRIFIKQIDFSLKIEMINDVPFHHENFVSGIIFNRIDSWQNIFSNKISALQRNEPKDIADILFLCRKYSFNWQDMIEAAKMKDMWVNELEVSSHINSFSVDSLHSLLWIAKPDFKKLSEMLKIISKEILLAADNSIVKTV